MKVKDIMREDNTMYKVIKNDPTTGIELQRPDDPHSTLHLDPEAAKAIAANPDNPNQFTMNPAIAGAMGTDAPQGPQQGAEVEIPATEDYELEQDMMQKGRRNRKIGGDDTDEYIDAITDHDFEQNAHEDFLGFGNKSPEDWAKTSKQMAELLKLQKAYQGTQYQSQIEKRIKILKDRLDMDAGEVAGPGGMPKPVVPPEKFNQFNEIGEVPAAVKEAWQETYPVKMGPEPTAIVHRTGGRGLGPLPIVASNPDWTEITPEFARKIGASAGTRYIMLHVEGQLVPALLGINKITVVPSDYQKITANPQVKEEDEAPANTELKTSSDAEIRARLAAQKGKGTKLKDMNSFERMQWLQGTGQYWDTATQTVKTLPVKESADDKLLQQMLSIAGLK